MIFYRLRLIDFMVVHSLLVVSSTLGPLPRILVLNLSSPVIPDDVITSHTLVLDNVSIAHPETVPGTIFNSLSSCGWQRTAEVYGYTKRLLRMGSLPRAIQTL